MLDLLIINANAAHGIYGKLGDDLVAIEQPLWARLIAGYIRDRGFSVKICDAEALKLNPVQVAEVVKLLKPRLVCLAVYGHQPSASTQQMDGAGKTAKAIKALAPHIPVLMVGGHVSALPHRTLQEETIDYACVGEGPVTIANLLGGTETEDIPGLVWRDAGPGKQIYANQSALLIDLKELHGNVWDLLPMELYRCHNWQNLGNPGSRQPYASIFTSLGCPYKCLAGGTLVNTIYGDITIKELCDSFGDDGVPVYTYDLQKKRTIVSQAINIRQYGVESLVRVHFDDGTFIDCTPDHKFMQFTWDRTRGSRGKKVQWECEAKELHIGSHVKAIQFTTRKEDGRVYVRSSKDEQRKLRSRLIMEFLLGRKLKKSEPVHHIDHNKSNDSPDNLKCFNSMKEHFKEHPEISERMRRLNLVDNPMRREKFHWWISFNDGDCYRSVERRHPNDKPGYRRVAYSKEINHRVILVEPLEQKQPVYCLTVPSTGWFYANNVLVKNCGFCCINAPFETNRYRMRDPLEVVEEVLMLYRKYGVKTFKITDEMFVLNERHYKAICAGIIASGISSDLNIWAYSRIDTVKPENLSLLRRAGFRWLALGIESGSAHVRDGASKKLRNNDIVGIVRAIQNADINVIGNYIFGLPDDDLTTMQATLDLAQELNTEFANFYSAMAYPGSKLYDDAIEKGWRLPESWKGFSQHNSDARPLDTEHIDAATVLRFRDNAFLTYFSSPRYQDMILAKFGPEALAEIKRMTTYKLDRKLLKAA